MPVNAPPTSTDTVNGWSPNGAATLHDCVGVDNGDTTYISCSDGTQCVLGFSATEHPNRTDGHVLRLVSEKAVDTTQDCALRIQLYSAGVHVNNIASSTGFDFYQEDTYTLVETTLLDEEAAQITDYDTLKVVIIDLLSPLTAEHRITLVELEIPDRILRAHVG